jgi:hypothetical protein
MLNTVKLRVPYDEEFVYGLQCVFFYRETNGIRERILSGQHLLQMLCVADDEKMKISETLLKVASSTDFDLNTRADAADVVLRLGIGEQRLRARSIITDLGYSAVDTKNNSLAERSRTIYTDSQNIHRFSDQIDLFIEKMIRESTSALRPFHEVHREVCDHVRSRISDSEKKFQAFRALNRISIDTARFTSFKATLSEIFVHVWVRIVREKDEEKKEGLIQRMIEELIDMGDTCSSGHSGRFINILAGTDVNFSISWEEQILSNMTGRMQARIRNCSDELIAEALALAESEFGSEEDRKIYFKFIRDNLLSLKEELHHEFVTDGKYVSEEVFLQTFEKGSEEWLKKEKNEIPKVE